MHVIVIQSFRSREFKNILCMIPMQNNVTVFISKHNYLNHLIFICYIIIIFLYTILAYAASYIRFNPNVTSFENR